MSEHLTMMSNMIGKLRDTGHALTDEQQVRAVISIGDASKNLDLYELEEVEPTLPSPSEGGELVPHPVVAEDSVSDLQPSGSIPDSGSTPQGPLGQQDSQLRRGFEMIEQDHCVYVKRSKKNILILSLYVDDILLAGNDMSSIVATKQWLSSTFEMKDMGEANYVLGVKIALGITAHVDEAVVVHCENTAALDFVNDPKYHGNAFFITSLEL
ncbi:hypothetical protein RJ640_027063 [Escallonia rubra]|uniref:Reverse transcriptase Ty1/copia-type domain-containing protein n=1 Tax=Escallonia rubra TaxID=112253 RepID=A0AA88U191_9ASTE|nr:hypothetical protein RJ640_027063 [Escallonia rubra]